MGSNMTREKPYRTTTMGGTMDWWRGLDRKIQLALGLAAFAVVGGAIAAAVAFSGGDADATRLPGKLAETTATAAGEQTATAAEESPVVPSTPADKKPTPSEPSQPDRVFGALRGIRDESGGSWQEVWIDIDTADFLTGSAALAYLTSQGDQDFYDPDYWYVRDEGVAITSYRIPPSGQGVVNVTMYTYPNIPSIGFYGPSMDKQDVSFGQFYDAIYMDEDSSHLLGRYYWFTVEEDVIVDIEEQPRDPYYEP